MFEKLTQYTSLKYFQQLREHLATPLYTNSYLLILNQGLSAVLGFLYWMIAARFLSAEVVGRGSAIISTIILISMLAELSLKSAMQRFIPRAGKHIIRLILIGYGASLLATAVLTVGFFVAGNTLHIADSLLVGYSTKSLGLLVLAAMLWTVFFVQDGILMGLRETRWVLLENTIYNASKILLLIIGISGFLGDAIVASWFIPTAFVVLLVNALIFTRFIPTFGQMDLAITKPVRRREVVVSIVGDHVGSILAETSTRLLPLLIVDLVGPKANAYFYQAWLIASMIYAVSANVTSAYTVEVSSNFNRLVQYSRKTMRYLTFLIVPMMLVLFIIAPFVLKIYGGEYSQQGSPLLRWLALAALPYGVNSWFLSYSRVRADVKSIIWNQGLQFVLTLGLSFLWLRPYGITSVGVAWLVAQSVSALGVLYVAREIIFRRAGIETVDKQKRMSPTVTYQPLKANWSEGLPITGGGSRTMDMTGDTYLFLSPHLDDAVLSCGGLMARLASAGERVVMATLFTGDVPQGSQVSWLARRNLRAWGLDGSAFRARQLEDEAASRMLGVEPVHLGLLDAMYRSRADGTPYYLWNTVGIPLDEEDNVITGRAIQNALIQIAKNCTSSGNIHVFTPICAGQHVDHLLTRCSAEAVFDPKVLIYYEDHPYAAHPGVHIDPDNMRQDNLLGVWKLAHVALTEKEVDTRIEAVACYSSQIPGLFPSPSERIIEVLSTRVPLIGKHLWELHWHSLKPQKSRQRMEKILREYIARVGGENYWYRSQGEE